MKMSDALKFFHLVLKKYGKWFLKKCGNPVLEGCCRACEALSSLLFLDQCVRECKYVVRLVSHYAHCDATMLCD